MGVAGSWGWFTIMMCNVFGGSFWGGGGGGFWGDAFKLMSESFGGNFGGV